MSRVAVANAIAFVVLAACAPPAVSRTTPLPSSATVGSPTPLGASGCHPASPAGAFAGEVYGTATGGSVWAWFMNAYPPKAGIEDKTLWRLDGPHVLGTPHFTVSGPADQPGRLNWGPTFHDASS